MEEKKYAFPYAHWNLGTFKSHKPKISLNVPANRKLRTIREIFCLYNNFILIKYPNKISKQTLHIIYLLHGNSPVSE